MKVPRGDSGTGRFAPRTDHVQRLFSGIAPQYESMAALLTFGLDRRWRAALVADIPATVGIVPEVAGLQAKSSGRSL